MVTRLTEVVDRVEISYYEKFVSKPLLDHLKKQSVSVAGVPDLKEVGKGGGLETVEALKFLCQLYERVRPRLENVLNQREMDRRSIDQLTYASYHLNRSLGIDYLDPTYETFVNGEKVAAATKTVAPIPSFLQGPHVTLFGPPDDAKLCINAMNAYHRRIKDEPPIVAELLKSQKANPMWGADDEDSKTPLRSDLVSAGENLSACFDKTIQFQSYHLEKDHLSLPIKRFPGLALPGLFLFYKDSSIPLHLYDFALHLFKHKENPEALVFYVPKLETVEEANYIHFMIEEAERLLKMPPTVRLLIVLENPRAIFKTGKIMDVLHPYFAGASLGWHDFLSSTARLFKNDSNYRIPVKADPEIVIKYIKESHHLLADVVGSQGGIKIGGMYGVLPTQVDLLSPSVQTTLKGFIKDIVTQLKRELTGFWVAHPDFVRIGLAFVEAWRIFKGGDKSKLETLVTSLLDKKYQKEILDFIHGPDAAGLDASHPLYPRSLIVADMKESTYIANNHPDEIRYNVRQSLHYLIDWLSGNGCVALPASIGGVPVRVMDDLATAERSRWEVWHEIYHRRFLVEEFLKIAHEEMTVIRKASASSKWHATAMRLMTQLMTSENPPEFASELLLPFTIESIRSEEDPWDAIQKISPGKFRLSPYVERFHTFFSICGSLRFARAMAEGIVPDLQFAESIVKGFDIDEIISAAYFHGDIGEAKKGLDSVAAKEQALVEENKTLISLGNEYREKFGFKFLISAKGRNSAEISAELKKRIGNTQEQELENARNALWEITNKRLLDYPSINFQLKPGIAAVQICISSGNQRVQSLAYGTEVDTLFQIASLSKTVAAAFSLEYFEKKGISLDTSVNSLLAKTETPYRIPKGDAVTITHLLEHSALNLHYIDGYPSISEMPPIRNLLQKVQVLGAPGEKFNYSGGGFLVLEHLIESMEGKPIAKITKPFLESRGLKELTFEKKDSHPGRFFPAFAAGAVSTATDFHRFLATLVPNVRMLHGTDKGSRDFMGADLGLGIFTIEAGPNRFMLHQGANEGFRCLFVYCFSGPDLHKGFTILAKGDNEAVPYIAETAQQILKALRVEGIAFERFKSSFDYKNIPQEQIVNLGYKELLFNSFEPDLPEAIEDKGLLDPLSKTNLAVGAKILSVTNEKFARAENLLSPYLPKFDPELYGRQGKIMDSWESARHNPKGCDALVIQLAKPSAIGFATFSTQFHLGNQAPMVRLEGRSPKGEWEEIVPNTPLEGHSFKIVTTIKPKTEYEYIRVSMIPDGGLTRLGLFKDKPPVSPTVFQPIPHPKKPLAPKYDATPEKVNANWNRLKPGVEVDLASSAYGGKILSASNEHYGPASQVISPYPPIHMFDGFESARSREPGHSEHFVIALGRRGKIHRLELDFTYFKNNNPKDMSIEALANNAWVTLLSKTYVKPFAGGTLVLDVNTPNPVDQLRVNIFPDGGINRIRAFGKSVAH